MVQIAAGSVIAGKYRLERPLARGGMGAVWVGRHIQLDSDVAIKFMAPEYGARPDLQARFEREAKASALMKVANVVHVHDYGIEDDTPYLVMELLHGEDLQTRLTREKRIRPEAMVSIVEQVCKGLRSAHEAGLIHRDLKPTNIFLARQGEEEVVKILDFGIAKTTGTGLVGKSTKTGTLVGSPHYMSPEQVRQAKEIDYRSDLWCVGVIIFQCLTGQLPFPSAEVGDVLVDICTEDIPIASQIVPDLPSDLDEFLAHALMREPDERFQSARDLAEAFTAIVEGTPHGAADSTLVTGTRSVAWKPKRGGVQPWVLITAVLGTMILAPGMIALIFSLAPHSDARQVTTSMGAAPPPILPLERTSTPQAPSASAPFASSAPSPDAVPSPLVTDDRSGARPTEPPPVTDRADGKPAPHAPNKKPSSAPLTKPAPTKDRTFGF